MNINKVLESANVQRFHAVPNLSGQTIAQHSWGVAMLCEYFEPNCRKEVIMAALTHDCAELVTGDIPATTKWDNPEFKIMLNKIEERVETEWGIRYILTENEQALLKICDAMDGMNYCIERYKMGEISAKIIFNRWKTHVKSNLKLDAKQLDYFRDIIHEMENI